jgi:hypothetical protein
VGLVRGRGTGRSTGGRRSTGVVLNSINSTLIGRMNRDQKKEQSYQVAGRIEPSTEQSNNSERC